VQVGFIQRELFVKTQSPPLAEGLRPPIPFRIWTTCMELNDGFSMQVGFMPYPLRVSMGLGNELLREFYQISTMASTIA